MKSAPIIRSIIFVLFLLSCPVNGQTNYPIIDTGQEICYNVTQPILPPLPGQPFYGQDAQYNGIQPNYQDNEDGTITDLNTGLMWQKTPDLENKSTFFEALEGAETFNLAGYDDWRLPSIKELYSLIQFYGSSFDTIAYIDTSYFDFAWGNISMGERLIDAQYWSSTQYVGLTMPGGDTTVFGVNFADGRIKGYPRDAVGPNPPMQQFVRYVRGNSDYGVNDFEDNGDGSITDNATGLMWQKADDGITRNWEDALEYAENLELAGYSDWRLSNAKELQSIVDYTRAPDAANPAQQSAAIDPIFDISEEESWFWTGTTLMEAPPEIGTEGVYIAFGRAMGYMFDPFMQDTIYCNVHGAGAQRGDPKDGNPAQWPWGFGPQGDEIRIFNYVRCVRDADNTGLEEYNHIPESPEGFSLKKIYPNPFNPCAAISFELRETSNIVISVYDISGRYVTELMRGTYEQGYHEMEFNLGDLSSGVYYVLLRAGNFSDTEKMVLIK